MFWSLFNNEPHSNYNCEEYVRSFCEFSSMIFFLLCRELSSVNFYVLVAVSQRRLVLKWHFNDDNRSPTDPISLQDASNKADLIRCQTARMIVKLAFRKSNLLRSYLTWWGFGSKLIRLYHPQHGITDPKYKLCFLTNIFCKEKKALAFNQDRRCHRALCLELILFHGKKR